MPWSYNSNINHIYFSDVIPILILALLFAFNKTCKNYLSHLFYKPIPYFSVK